MQSLVHFYSDFKHLIEVVAGFVNRDTLHVHLGILLFLLLWWRMPEPHRFRRAFVCMLVISVLNECLDLLMAHQKGEPLNWLESLLDIINTLLWPAALCVFEQRIVRVLGNARSLDKST